MVFNNSLAGGIMFVALLSLGEAMWSPRLYEYTVIVAPDQKEGTFMAFSHMPSFVANFISGPMSGILLQSFCPSQGKLRCEMMWLIIGKQGVCRVSVSVLLAGGWCNAVRVLLTRTMRLARPEQHLVADTVIGAQKMLALQNRHCQ